MKRFNTRQTCLLFLLILLSVFLITGCGGGQTVTTNSDSTAPTVTYTVPVNNATDVPINTKICATFSESMDPLTITNVKFTLKETVTGLPCHLDTFNIAGDSVTASTASCNEGSNPR